MAAHILPTHCWLSRHHHSRDFCPHLPKFGPDSVVVFPKHKPLSDEIGRDLDCWIGVWTQECDCRGETSASSSALSCFSGSRPRLLGPRRRRPSTAAVPKAFCAQAPVLHSREKACREVHVPNFAHLLVHLPALAHLLATVRRIVFLALDRSRPKSLALSAP